MDDRRRGGRLKIRWKSGNIERKVKKKEKRGEEGKDKNTRQKIGEKRKTRK